MQPADTLIAAPWIVPVEPAGAVLEDHALVVHEGRIADLLPRALARSRYRAAAEVALATHVLVRGSSTPTLMPP